MKNYLSINGKKIEISDETAKNLKKQFKEEPEDLVGYGFVVGLNRVERTGYSFAIAVERNGGIVGDIVEKEEDDWFVTPINIQEATRIRNKLTELIEWKTND